MRYTCPECESTDTALCSCEEGWDPSGPYGIQTTKKHYRCRECGERWEKKVDVSAPTE